MQHCSSDINQLANRRRESSQYGPSSLQRKAARMMCEIYNEDSQGADSAAMQAR